MSRKLLIEIIAGLFIVLFLYTALNKLIDNETFKRALAAGGPTKPYATLLSWLVPISEIVTVALLFFPRTKKTGFYVSAVLMLAFTGYITYMLVGSSFRPCSCGGVINSFTWPQHLVFNIFFTILAFLAIWLTRRKKDISGPTSGNRLKFA